MKLSVPASIIVLSLFALLAAVVLLNGPLRRSLVDDDSTKVRIAALASQLKSFPVPEGSTKVSPDDASDREVLTSVSSRYHADGTSQEIIDHYASLAESRGWQPRERKSDQERRFCKEGVSLTILAKQLKHGVDYTIELVWTNQVRSLMYCP